MNFSKKLIVGTSIPLALTVALAGVCLISVNSLIESNGWVDHTHNVISEAKSIESSAVDMETGMRGYLLAGKEEFLEPYKQGRKSFYEKVAELKKTVSDNPPQVALLGEIENTISEWQTNVTEPTIALRRTIGDAETMNDIAKLVGEAKGKVYFDRFRKDIATFTERERVLLAERRHEAETTTSPAAAVEQARWVDHTYRVIDEAKDILASAINMETGMRGYLLAGKEEFLEPYDGVKESFFQRISDLQETVSDNPPQVELLGEIKATMSKWQSLIAEPTIALRRKIGDSKTMDDMADLISEARGKQYFDKFRSQIATFANREHDLMQVRQERAKKTASFARYSVIVGTAVIVVLAASISIVLIRSITQPIDNTISMFQVIADGNLTGRLDENRKDEFGVLAKHFNQFVENLQSVIGKMSSDAITLNSSSNQMAGNAEELVSRTEGATNKSTAVSAAAEQMSVSMNAIASSTGEVSDNVQSVAISVEEMTSSIGEVAQNAAEAATVAGQAAQLAQKSNDKIGNLNVVADEIGSVIDVIQEIAEQTNLLALNATIESARAGDAGKGFAVVASEVKDLARQTSTATADIRSRIEGIQNSTGEAVEAGRAIGSVIATINEVSSTIAAAVEEQNASTNQIAENISQTATATEIMSRGINESAAASQEITRNISEVSQVLKQTASGVQQSKESGIFFSDLAQQMEQTFSQFQTE